MTNTSTLALFVKKTLFQMEFYELKICCRVLCMEKRFASLCSNFNIEILTVNPL